jgi:hypothetical protein
MVSLNWDTRHDSVHIFGAAIITPAVNTEAMNEHLAEISTQVASGAHCLLVCACAGWHQPGERRQYHDTTAVALRAWIEPKGNGRVSKARIYRHSGFPNDLKADS